ncbi:MAG: ATP-binding protein [Litorimonas sp.]
MDLAQTGTLNLLLHVLNLLPNPVYVKDRQHRWVEANTAFCALLGRPREQLLGKSDYDFNPSEQAKVFWAMDDEVFHSQGKNVNHEETVNAAGETLWVESQKSYFQADDGAEYLVGVLTDLTEMKSREVALAKAEKTALAAATAKSEFLANMSHEIRTPMNGVLGMTQVLRGTGLTKQQSELVNTLERSGDALLSLIDDVLDFSKIEAGQMRLSPEPFELRRMVDDVAVLLGATARDKGLDLIVQFGESLPSHLIGDPGRLRQILMNLIGNAIKFTQTGYISVEVDGVVKGDLLQLSACICDTGIGIVEDKLATVFEKFQQADGSTTRLYGGTGLGLAISRNLAELMDGALTATSVLGQGSRFRLDVILPISEGVNVEAPTYEALPDLDRLKILTVDDIPLNLDIIASQLSRLGLKADTVGSAKDAVARLVSAYNDGDPYTLLITDFQMPGYDGLKMTQTLRQHKAFEDLSIIVMSSVNDASVRDAFKAARVSDYLVKPITLPDFDRMILDTANRLST